MVQTVTDFGSLAASCWFHSCFVSMDWLFQPLSFAHLWRYLFQELAVDSGVDAFTAAAHVPNYLDDDLSIEDIKQD